MARRPLPAARPQVRVLSALAAAAFMATACGSTVDTAASGAQGAGVVDGGSGLVAPGDPALAGSADGLAVGSDGLAGPGSTSGSGTSGSSAGGTVGGAGGGGGAVGGPGSSGGQAPTGTGSTAPLVVPTTGHAPGVTATTIRIGFIAVDQAGASSASAAYGVPGAVKAGDPRTEIDAIVKYVNSQGGIAGRKVEHFIVIRDPGNSDPNYGESICTKFTQDHKVFAVVTNASLDAEACYAKRHTLLINDGVMSSSVLNQLSPYIWVPGQPSAEAGYSALLDSLVGQKWFTGAKKLGFVGADSPTTLVPYKTVVQPRLAKLGFADKEIERVLIADDADTSQFQAAVQSAVLKFKSEGVDHVFFMVAGGGAPLIFMNQAQSQAYFPRYAFSSYDTPGFVLQAGAPPTQLRGSLGAGWFETADVDAAHGDPYPTGPAEKECYKAVQSNGDAPPPARAAGFTAAVACDGAFMLRDAGIGLKDALSTEAWGAAAERLGKRFQASYSLPNGTEFVVGRRAGGAVYRDLAFIDTCNCFQYLSGNKPIPQ